MSKRQINIYYTATSVFFVAVLLVPFVYTVLGIKQDSITNEKRAMAERPRLDINCLDCFPQPFETYYNEHFCFRDQLIQLDAKIKYHLFNTSPVPDKVAIGSEGWLYLTGRFYEVDQDITRENRFNEGALLATISTWEARKKELNERHISYYHTVWPDKHYIYPEYLPPGMKLAQSTLPARCDQTIEYLRDKKSVIHVIDVRPELLIEKNKQQLYYKNDSHWNTAGAFIAYTKLMEQIKTDFPDIKSLTKNDFNIHSEIRNGGDLSNMINIPLTDVEPIYTPKVDTFHTETLPVDNFPKKTEIYKTTNPINKLRVLIYRDSFTTALLPFLKKTFGEIYLIWDTPYDVKMVDTIKPDIVIESYATRYFR
ncbi:MAG: hypothetical protein JST26_02050 [Bacteroidetes bacterium]|nr:hypothetical protein [Bacteroidota bacterium]